MWRRKEDTGIEEISWYFEYRTVPFLRRKGGRRRHVLGGGGDGVKRIRLRRQFWDFDKIPQILSPRPLTKESKTMK